VIELRQPEANHPQPYGQGRRDDNAANGPNDSGS
jgi:hypothetical protein